MAIRNVLVMTQVFVFIAFSDALVVLRFIGQPRNAAPPSDGHIAVPADVVVA
jgi:hypothetical protein